jgi:hypothetical protein
VTVCVNRHIPSRDPMFHMYEILLGEGRSTRDFVTILSMGFIFRCCFFILGSSL